jgi:hypothetical protein
MVAIKGIARFKNLRISLPSFAFVGTESPNLTRAGRGADMRSGAIERGLAYAHLLALSPGSTAGARGGQAVLGRVPI